LIASSRQSAARAANLRRILRVASGNALETSVAVLRASGNAYYAVRKCALTRTGQAVGGTTMTPRLSAQCDIDLITIIDRAAKG